MLGKLYVCLICLFLTSVLLAQENQIYRSGELDKAVNLFEENVLASANQVLENFEAEQSAHFLSIQKDEDALAQQLYSLSLLLMDESSAEGIALINRIKSDHSAYENESLIALADFYYIRNDFAHAVEYYDLIDYDDYLDAGISFRQAYSHFVLKEFDAAIKSLSRIKNLNTQYYYPSNYYFAMSAYFLGNYPTAIRALEIVKDQPDYSKYSPYYLAQLYFAQNEIDKLINYIEPLVEQEDLYKRYELHSLLGQAYINIGNYEKALKYLEIYERQTDKLTDKEFYQIAISYYNLDNYRKAARTFAELSKTVNPYQISSMYHLADCYLKRKDKNSAKAVFQNLSKRREISETERSVALWNFAKLSIETENSREAINALRQINSRSEFYAEARQLLVRELYQSEDYNTALLVLKEQGTLDRDLKVLYQTISLRKAKQLYLDKNFKEAKKAFYEVEDYPVDKNLSGESFYWLAKIDFENEAYAASNLNLNKFFQLKPTKLPLEASQGMAHYLKGYNHFRLKEFDLAAKHFRACTNSLKANMMFYDKILISSILIDAHSRNADAYFLLSAYDAAVSEYNAAANLQTEGSDYALYQKGLIEGLQGKHFDKILSMEEIVGFHEESTYRDDALYQLGNTYLILNDNNQALQKYQQLAEEYMSKSELTNKALLKIGLISYNQGDTQNAIDNYKYVLANQPTAEEKYEALLALKEIYVEDLSDPDEYFSIAAQEGFEITAYSKDSLSFAGAYALYDQANFEKASQAFKKYNKDYKNGSYKLKAHYLCAEAYLKLKKYNEAETEYAELIKIGDSPYYFDALKKASVIAYNHQNNFEKSFGYYKILSAQDLSASELIDARQGALRSAFRSGMQAEILHFADLLIANGGISTDDLSTIHFYKAKAFLNQNQADEAIPALNQVVQLSKNNQAAEASYIISDIFYKKGSLDQAEAQALETTKRAANYPLWVSKSILLLAQIYHDKADYLNAKAALEALIENYKDDPSIITEAQQLLDQVNLKINESNRIKIVKDTSILELDTLRNE